MNREVSQPARTVAFLLLAFLPGLAAHAAQSGAADAQRLKARAGGQTLINFNPGTGAARFVRLAPGSGTSLSPLDSGTAEAKAEAFFREYPGLFGIQDPQAELHLADKRTDSLGITRLTYRQQHAGIPVFAAVIRAHFDRSGRMIVVNGVSVPGIAVGTQPRIGAAEAGRVAVTRASVRDKKADGAGSSAVAHSLGSKLVIFRTGLVKGEAGASYLAYQVEVSNGGDIHSDVFVDAQTGKYLDAISRDQDVLFRRSFDGENDTVEPGPNYPTTPFWIEGDPFPTGTAEADNMILASIETYNIYENAFNYDTGGLYPFFPATSGEMHSIFDRGWGCPNASWNSTYISFCPGFTTDDVTGHEWSHAYTEFTSGLIYQWQSGALNESYSDVWGESIDQINGRGADTPATPRTADSCALASAPAELLVNSPPPIAGIKVAQRAAFGAPPTALGITGNIVRVDNGSGGDLACTASGGITNGAAVSGNIALIQRGTCTFVEKVQNAQDVGAIAVIVYNNQGGLPGMGGASATITITSVGITTADGQAIIANSPANATIRLTSSISLDDSLLWLMGEEVGQAPGGVGGALRDMWNPTCFSNPGKVSDTTFYVCGTADGGGVHTNSGIPNHTYALLVSGGTYNGHNVAAIGMVKAAHLWFRSQSQYLVPPSNFDDFADALEQSCVDLTGANLPNISTATGGGGPSGQIIGPADCAAVTEAIAATELRLPPTFCNFQPLLNPNTPPPCGAGEVPAPFFQESFEGNPFLNGWTQSLGPVTPDFTYRTWTWVNTLPDRPGSGLFALDFPGGNCAPGGDESGVVRVTSPSFTVPSSSARLSFEHNVATEATFDGANLKVSVNGGAFTLVPFGAFTFNPPNATFQPTNPLAGEDGWTGTDGGENSGSWGTTVINLAGVANAGDSVQLRWDFGQDGCGAVIGTYVDNVSGYVCQAGGGTPGISIGDVTLNETDSGTTAANFSVTLTPADPSASHSVDFQTSDGTATTADNDYLPLNGTIVFGPNETLKNITISVVGDTNFEADETFTVSLSNATGAAIVDGVGVGTILNDDKPLAVNTKGELIHDSRETRDLDPISRFWRISQKAHSSYEVVTDAVTGDIGLGGPDLLRVGSDGTAVLQTGVSTTGGTSKNLRFSNNGATENNSEFIRVRSAGCTAECDTNDTVRIRAYDTTYRISRFNNNATQITVLVIANPTDQDATGTLWFFGAANGSLLTSQIAAIPAHGTFVLNTSTLAPLQGQAGSATFSNDAAFGALTGKAVAVEPATGFTFDTAMVPRSASTKMVPRDN